MRPDSKEKFIEIGETLIEALGYDVTEPGLINTPRRFADAWLEFINYDPGNVDTTFESVETDQLVLVTGIRVYSMCEHHLLPFWCDISIGYIANEHVLGLSKFARIAHKHAHKLQLQERLVQNIADEISELTKSDSVAVLARGVHMCMVMRGVKTSGTMITSIMRGSFRESDGLRREFLSLARSG